MTRSQGKAQAIKLITNMLIARRQGNLSREQAAYNRLATLCRNNGFDFENVMTAGVAEVRRNPAAIMQGW